MVKARLLLIDDDWVVYESLSAFLQMYGYELMHAQDGAEGLRYASESSPDLILLDILMPGMTGWEVCKRLRQESSVPIIILTAKSDEKDVLHGFQLGADDYVEKPFSFAILEARISAVLARSGKANANDNTLVSEELMINFERRRVTLEGEQIELTPTEYRLLEILAQHANRTVPVSKLIKEVWGSDYTAEDRYVKQFIWALRKKIEIDPNEPKHLVTHRGYGYRFE